MKATTVIKKATKGINQFYNPRSAWNKGVKAYAVELLEKLQERAEYGSIEPDDLTSPKMLEKALLNGAYSWNEYSEGGCSQIYDEDIAKRLCTPSELKITRNGERNPNKRESWIDCQARALYQAANLVKSYIKSYL